ncbi:hypothetical protein [Halostagnicola sp. A-GB9-2]|uniref:hypothetical protein n=1 Tax=Halostagnicola sp. A-GB9-2 TaxID=3048066 RepID=UPI0024C0800A|nr:hypothetical protein [Halostagnicola sp. A-GB9-2]MDJ1434042.1 hypothetical protein [Halostagnicola sp. A-GB9-2]
MQEQTRVLLDYPFPEERVFRYQAMQDILHHLVNTPFEEFTQKELATITGADVSSVSRSVDLLEQLGVLTLNGGKPAEITMDQDHFTGSNPLLTIPQQEFRKPVKAFLDELTDDIEPAPSRHQLSSVHTSLSRGRVCLCRQKTTNPI